MYQTKSKSGQDPLNFPIRLNNKLAHLNSLTRMGSYAPTDQAIAFKNEIMKKLTKNYQNFIDLSIRCKTTKSKSKRQSD